MSVLACDRDGCSSVMCDHLINGSHYLCDFCLVEFKACVRTWPTTLMNHPYTTPDALVRQFMATPPGTYLNLVGVLEAFDNMTKFLISTRS